MPTGGSFHPAPATAPAVAVSEPGMLCFEIPFVFLRARAGLPDPFKRGGDAFAGRVGDGEPWRDSDGGAPAGRPSAGVKKAPSRGDGGWDDQPAFELYDVDMRGMEACLDVLGRSL